jgi:hypothetical protein
LAAFLAVAAAYAQQSDGTNYAELQRIAQSAKARAFAEKANATLLAKQLGMPTKVVDPKTGRVIEVMKISPNGMPIYYLTHNKDAAITTRASRTYTGGGAGLGLSGSGVIFGEWDSGSALTNHNELNGRVTNSDSAASAGHSTHVAGTMIANGSATLVIGGNNVPGAAKGMSFAGTVRSHDWDNDVSEVAAEAGAGTPIRLSNHSYGPGTGWTDNGSDWFWFGWTPDSTTEDSSFGRYSDECASFDAIAVNAPSFLSVWSAGNDRGEGPALASQPTGFYWDAVNGGWIPNNAVRDLDGGSTGYDSISGVGLAKNVMTVGAVDDVANYTGPGSVAMSSFSCWGPTDDGRIKPDVVGDGINLASTWNTSTSAYAFSSGTSMAAPNITGSMGLLVQHYRNTHGGADMRSSMLRGLVIHTADECGPNVGPDYMNGWGLMDTEAAAKVITDDQTNPDVMREDSLTQGQTDTFRVTTEGGAPLRFTICWIDPAGTPVNTGLDPSTKMLKHDLDMSVSQGATTYYPYVLTKTAPAAAAVYGDNDVDNVEVIDIPAPTAGVYTINITTEGTITGTQNYSLIVTGATVSPVMTAFTINGTWITGHNSTNGTVTINTAAPVGGFKVYPRVIPSGQFNINSPVIIPEGQTSKSFPIVGTGDVVANTPYSIWMDAGYKSIGVAGTTVPLRINALTVTPDPVSSGGSISVHIGLNGPAPTGGQVLIIDRAPTFWIQAPTQVTIPAGQFGATYVWPITAGLVNPVPNARITVKQDILPSGQVSLSKLFTINP